jgi:hypothetical protein
MARSKERVTVMMKPEGSVRPTSRIQSVQSGVNMANGKLYALNVDGFPKLDGKVRRSLAQFKGQAKLIFDEMSSNRQPRPVSEIAAAVEDKLETVQTAVKVVTYYVVRWRSEGIVTATVGGSDDASGDAAFDKLFASLTAESDAQ